MIVAKLKDTELDSSNVAASTESEYSDSTTYAISDVVKVSYESDGTTPKFPVEEYESLVGSNLDNYPPDSATSWSLIGATNRCKMFDGSTTSQTTNADYIEVEVDSGNTNVVGVFNMEADSVEFTQIYDSELITDGDGSTDAMTKGTGWTYGGANWSCDGTQTTTSLLYQSSASLIEDLWVQVVFTLSSRTAGTIAGYAYGSEGDYVDTDGTYTQVFQVTSTTDTYCGLIADADFVGTVDDISVKLVPKYELVDLSVIDSVDYWEYFFGDFNYLTDYAWYYPQYGSSTLRIKIANSSDDAMCGLAVLGKSKDLGLSEYNVTTGIIDYSIKTTDDLGRTTMSQGPYAKRTDVTCDFENNEVDGIQRFLSTLRGVPALWDCNNDGSDQSFESLVIYGYYDKFDILIPNYSISTCSMRINGLT